MPDEALHATHEELDQLRAEAERAKNALRIACSNVIALSEQRTKLTEALNSAMTLQDAMLNEIRRLTMLSEGQPTAPIQMLIAKGNFDAAMKKLLGEKQ